jgi:hypothetical protein
MKMHWAYAYYITMIITIYLFIYYEIKFGKQNKTYDRPGELGALTLGICGDILQSWQQ